MRLSPAEPGARAHALVRRFWEGDSGPAGALLDVTLWPAEQLFRAAVAGRGRAFDRGWIRSRGSPIPVVSIGNLRVGGAGKTPLAAWFAERLARWGREPAVVMRGFGGDEVLVHRELNPAIPVHTAVRRIEAVEAAARAGADVAVLDDGFQHRALVRDLDVVLIAADGFRLPLRLLPRGPWREGLSALARADMVVITRKAASREEAEAVEAAVGKHLPSGRVALCRIAPGALVPLHAESGEAVRDVQWLSGREVLAVSSLAAPAPFAENLRASGAEVEMAEYPDHHAFDAGDAARILERSRGRPAVVTLKDAVKLRRLVPASADVWVLRQRVELERGEEMVESALREAVRR